MRVPGDNVTDKRHADLAARTGLLEKAAQAQEDGAAPPDVWGLVLEAGPAVTGWPLVFAFQSWAQARERLAELLRDGTAVFLGGDGPYIDRVELAREEASLL